MKNKIILDYDSERENVLMIGKPSDFVIPKTKDDEIELVKSDITILIEALNALLETAHQNDFFTKKEINDNFLDKVIKL